jgi:hypothetical protein
LAAYYPTGPAGYWTGPPEHPDPESLYHLNDANWQAWTWEVRFHRGPPVFEAVRWAADLATVSELRQDLREALLAPGELDQLAEFVGRLQAPSGTLTFCEELEQWVREQCL